MVVHDVRIQRFGKIRNAQNFSSIQEAIDSLPSEGGKVFIPEGTYTITATITVPSNVTLEGAGWGTIIKPADSTSIHVIGLTDINNVILANFKIDGNKANVGAGFHAIRLEGCNDVLIDFIKVIDSSAHSIHPRATVPVCDNIIIKNCVVINSGGGGILGSLTNSIIEGNIIQNVVERGIQLHPDQISSNVVVCNNIIDTVGNNGLESLNPGNTEIIFVGNVVKDSSNHGIGINGIGVVVCDNVVTGSTNDGIRSGTISECTINGNTITDCRDGMRLVLADSVSISGNLCFDNSQVGIRLQGCSKCTVTNNVCKNNSSDAGIQLEVSGGTESIDNIISNNTCFDDQVTKTQGYGIRSLNSSSNNLYVNNHLKGNDTSPISIVDTPNCICFTNIEA